VLYFLQSADGRAHRVNDLGARTPFVYGLMLRALRISIHNS